MRPNRRPILLFVSLLLAALGLWTYWQHGRAEREVEKYKRQLRASGEKLTIAELRQSEIPEHNAASIFRQAMGYLNSRKNALDSNPPLAMRIVEPGHALIGWQRPDVRDKATNTWEEIEAVIEARAGFFDLLEQVAAKGNLDFQLDYAQGPFLLLMHLAPLRQSARNLSAAALCDMRRGDCDTATKRICSMLSLSKALEHEPLVISQLVRMSIAQMAVETEWELLQSPNFNSNQIARIQSVWSPLEFGHGAENALSMERATTEYMLARMRLSSVEFRHFASGWGGESWTATGTGFSKFADLTVQRGAQILWRSAWSYPDELKMLRGMQALLDAMRLAESEHSFENAFHQQEGNLAGLGLQVLKNKPEDKLYSDDPGLPHLFSQSVKDLQWIIHRVFLAEAARSIAVTALALKGYHLHNGRYPDELSQLVPDFLLAVPRDAADNQPLR